LAIGQPTHRARAPNPKRYRTTSRDKSLKAPLDPAESSPRVLWVRHTSHRFRSILKILDVFDVLKILNNASIQDFPMPAFRRRNGQPLYLFRTLLEPALIHSLQSVDSIVEVDRFSKVG
jgi:hypothetical protein